MAESFPDKDPGDRLEFIFDCSRAFDQAESIVTATWSITNNDATLVDEGQSIVSGEAGGNKATQIILSGGTVGTTYNLNVTITTNIGSPPRIYNRDLQVRVLQL